MTFIAGRDALSSIESAISDVRVNENRLAQVLGSAAAEADRLRKQLVDAFSALALVRLDTLIRNEAVGELSAAERRALEIMRVHKAKLEQLLIKHGGAQSSVIAAQVDHRNKTAAVDAAREPIKALQLAVEQKMKADPAWSAQRQIVDRALQIAAAADEKAKYAEADRDTKKQPYEADALFMYLWRRQFATANYQAGNVARFFDRKVASLVGYDSARPNYLLLNEIPQRLREHASESIKLAEAEDAKLEALERAALVEAGIQPLETQLAAAQAELKTASERLTKTQADLAALDQERSGLLDAGDRQAHHEALAVLSQAVAREDLQTMYREARETRTPEDDRLVGQIESTQSAITKADSDVSKIRDEAREIARRRSELESIRDRFRTQRYDNPGGRFEVEAGDALGNLIGGIVRGAIQGATLWALLEHSYRRRDWGDRDDEDDDDRDGGERGPWGNRSGPRFRFPSSSFPKIGKFGGGGFRSGGGFGGGGFRTGGKF